MQSLADRPVREAETAQRIIRRLAAAYPDLPAADVEAAVAAARERLAAARVRVFVPVFIERFAREALGRSMADRRDGSRPAAGRAGTTSGPPTGQPEDAGHAHAR